MAHPARLDACVVCLFSVLAFAGRAAGQEVSVVVSSKAGDRLTEHEKLSFSEGKAESAFEVDDSVSLQKMAGFGASFLEAGLICINSLPPAEQEKVFRALFDLSAGAGFSAMKTPIAGTDFMSAGPWYTYDDTPGDVEMKKFSIERDLGPNGLITYIKRARKHGKFVLQAPMDYPPDWMLVDVQKDQDVDPRFYDALSLYYLRYLEEYAAQGVAIDYLSLFNEPGVYTKIKYPEIRRLLAEHVGPLFEKKGMKAGIQPGEASNREDASKEYPVLLDDPAARKLVACLAYHGYDFDHFDKVSKLHERYSGLPMWMTEICHAYDAGTPRSMVLPRRDFEDGAFWGEEIVSDIEAGASAWIYWNMVLDERGGPWLVSEIHGNPPDNVQHPVVIVDRKEKKVLYTGLYWYLAHFSKYVRPGAVRVKTSGKAEGVRCVSFRDPGGTLVTQLLNRKDQDAAAAIVWRGKAVRLTLPAVSITTCAWRI